MTVFIPSKDGKNRGLNIVDWEVVSEITHADPGQNRRAIGTDGNDLLFLLGYNLPSLNSPYKDAPQAGEGVWRFVNGEPGEPIYEDPGSVYSLFGSMSPGFGKQMACMSFMGKTFMGTQFNNANQLIVWDSGDPSTAQNITIGTRVGNIIRPLCVFANKLIVVSEENSGNLGTDAVELWWTDDGETFTMFRSVGPGAMICSYAVECGGYLFVRLQNNGSGGQVLRYDEDLVETTITNICPNSFAIAYAASGYEPSGLDSPTLIEIGGDGLVRILDVLGIDASPTTMYTAPKNTNLSSGVKWLVKFSDTEFLYEEYKDPFWRNGGLKYGTIFDSVTNGDGISISIDLFPALESTECWVELNGYVYLLCWDGVKLLLLRRELIPGVYKQYVRNGDSWKNSLLRVYGTPIIIPTLPPISEWVMLEDLVNSPRADEDPLSQDGNWTGPALGESGSDFFSGYPYAINQLKIVDNDIVGDRTDPNGIEEQWSSSYRSDVEPVKNVWMAAKYVVGEPWDRVGLCLRIQNPGTDNSSAYLVYISSPEYPSNNFYFSINYITQNDWVGVGQSNNEYFGIEQALDDGAWIAFGIIDNYLYLAVSEDDGNTWTFLTARPSYTQPTTGIPFIIDTQITSPGFIGLAVDTYDGDVDNPLKEIAYYIPE